MSGESDHEWEDGAVTLPTPPTPSMRVSGALAGVLAGAAVAVSAFLPVWAVAAVVTVLGLLLSWGWPRLTNLPSPRGTFAVLGATTIALMITLLASDAGDRSRWAGAVLSVGLIGSFVHQLLRQDGRPRLVMSLAGTALGLGVLGAGSYVVTAADDAVAHRLLLAVGLAASLGCLVDGVAGATSRRLELGLGQTVLGAVVGALAVLAGADPVFSIAAGALSGLLSWACLRTTVTLATSAHTRAQLAAGCACVLVCGLVPVALAALA